MNDARAHLEKVLELKGFVFLSPIGHGGSASCYLVKSNKYETTFVCKQAIVSPGGTHPECEISILKRLSSANVISMYDCYVDHPYVYAFLEYCPNGTLMTYITDNGPPSGTLLLGLMKSLLTAVEFIHSQRVVHLDIKPNNILFDRYGRAKLADFGISRLVDDENGKIDHHAGTVAFMAPEMLRPGRFDPFKADIWALGITFFYLITGHGPWSARSRDQLKERISDGLFGSAATIPGKLRPLILAMCNRDPTKRPTATQLLSCPLFQTVDVQDGCIPEETAGQKLARVESYRERRVPLSLASVAKCVVLGGTSIRRWFPNEPQQPINSC